MEVLSLDNGLQYIFQQRKDTGVVALQIWVKVGSKYEEQKIAGNGDIDELYIINE